MMRPRKHPPEIRAARIAAVAAIAAAVISATSGIATYVTSQNQITAEDQRSSTEFLRSERKEAYTQLLADEQTLRQASLTYCNMAFLDADNDGVPAHATPEQLDAQAKVITDAFDKFNVSASRVELMGSTEVSSRLVGVRKTHAYVAGILTYRGEISLKEPESETRNGLRDIEEKMPDLIRLAKVDMGNG